MVHVACRRLKSSASLWLCLVRPHLPVINIHCCRLSVRLSVCPTVSLYSPALPATVIYHWSYRPVSRVLQSPIFHSTSPDVGSKTIRKCKKYNKFCNKNVFLCYFTQHIFYYGISANLQEKLCKKLMLIIIAFVCVMQCLRKRRCHQKMPRDWLAATCRLMTLQRAA